MDNLKLMVEYFYKESFMKGVLEPVVKLINFNKVYIIISWL